MIFRRWCSARRVLLVSAGLAVALLAAVPAGAESPLAAPPAIQGGSPPGARILRGRAPRPRRRSGVYYEIFVRSFCDSNGDGIGDLDGITEKLDYLKWLGVSGLWLTPINPSPSYHGYDITNFFAVNPQFGTLADFHRLLRAAHARGIKILMDLVTNHTSDRNPWFRRAISPTSPYHDWFTWAGKGTDLDAISSVGDKAWHRIDGEYYLGDFSSQMPDLNYDDPAVREAMIRVGRFWLAQGVDGFRLDATTQIYIDFESQVGKAGPLAKNLAWWSEFHRALSDTDPRVFLLGEVPATAEAQAAPYYSALNSVFDFPLARILIASAATEKSADLGAYLQRALRLFHSHARWPMVDSPFLSNHDQDRVIDQLHGNPNHMRMAAAQLLTLPGHPFVYYGEEIGMHGVKPDPHIREPMRWNRSLSAPGETYWENARVNDAPGLSVAAERTDPHSLLNLYRTLIHWRIELPALRDGGIAPYPADGGPICAYVRADRAQRLLIVHNLSGRRRVVTLTVGAFRRVIRRTRAGIRLEGRRLTMPAYSTAILE